MAYDAGMLAASVFEINTLCRNGRVDKINQPSRDEIVLTLRTASGAHRLLINAGANNPRLGISSLSSDNPDKPPLLCIMLRRHLSGSRLIQIRQLGFERAAVLEFAARDEMGFECRRNLIAEVMGKYSNLILTDGNDKIISAMKLVDFTTSSKRQVLPGMLYELPPKQDKLDPMSTTLDEFRNAFNNALPERNADKLISSAYLGISATVAREIVYRATHHTDTPVAYCDCDELFREFISVFDNIKNNIFKPTLILNNGSPAEYCFMPLYQYGNAEVKAFDSCGTLLDTYFGERDREQRTHQRAADLFKLLTNAEARIIRKLDSQRSELSDSEQGFVYKEKGDLITANIYKLKRGDTRVLLTNYAKLLPNGEYEELEVELDARMTPAANAQKFYKKYAKSKKAQTELAKQIKLGEAELDYIHSVFNSLSHAETAADLIEIRDELFRSGYASKMKSASTQKSSAKPIVAKFTTHGGFTVLCGKNNIQNDYITFKLAEKDDWWFHAKGTQGSHVLLVSNGNEIGDSDFTEAAEIAAYYSRSSAGARIEVDYTKAKNVKKPANGKPGLVIYHTNWSCVVTPNEEKIKAMRIK